MHASIRTALTLALLLATPSLAWSQDPGTPEGDARAKELFENGASLYDDGLYEDAAAAWEEAYRLSKRELLLFNLANAYERMGHLEQALDHLNRYRAFAPAEESEALLRRIGALEKRVREVEEERAAEEARLAEEEARLAEEAARLAEEAKQAEADKQAPPADPEPEPVDRGLPVALPVAVATAGIGTVAVGALFGVQANGLARDLDDQCTALGADDAPLCPSSAKDTIDAQHAKASLGRTLIVSGLVGTAVGGGLFALTDTRIVVSPRSIALQGRF